MSLAFPSLDKTELPCSLTPTLLIKCMLTADRKVFGTYSGNNNIIMIIAVIMIIVCSAIHHLRVLFADC